jgi:hypothetical protein
VCAFLWHRNLLFPRHISVSSPPFSILILQRNISFQGISPPAGWFAHARHKGLCKHLQCVLCTKQKQAEKRGEKGFATFVFSCLSSLALSRRTLRNYVRKSSYEKRNPKAYLSIQHGPVRLTHMVDNVEYDAESGMIYAGAMPQVGLLSMNART